MILDFSRWIPRTDEDDYVSIVNEDACNSKVGRVGGKQLIRLTGSCFYRGVVAHEMMHALGNSLCFFAGSRDYEPSKNVVSS